MLCNLHFPQTRTPGGVGPKPHKDFRKDLPQVHTPEFIGHSCLDLVQTAVSIRFKQDCSREALVGVVASPRNVFESPLTYIETKSTLGEFQYFMVGTMWQAVEKRLCDLRRLSHVSFEAVLLECCGHCILHRAQAGSFSNFPCMSLWQILWDTSMGPPEARHRAVLIASRIAQYVMV